MTGLKNHFLLNLALSIIFGVGALYWIWYHTEYLEIVGGLLGLGGVFAWIAFLSNLISDDRKKQMQASFESWLGRRSNVTV